MCVKHIAQYQVPIWFKDPISRICNYGEMRINLLIGWGKNSASSP